MPTEPATDSTPVIEAPSGLRATVLRSAAQFSLANVVSQMSGLVRAYFILRLLGPASAGVWLALQLVVTYGGNAHLGAIYGMHRNIPLLKGKGDLAGADAVKRTTLTFTLLAGAASFLIVALATSGLLAPLEMLAGDRGRDVLAHLREPGVRGIALAVGAVLPVNLLRSYYATLFRAENRFREASIASLSGSVVGVLVIVLIPWYGLTGVVWGLFALIAAEALYLAALAGPPRLGLNGAVLRDQLAVGLLTVATTVVGTLLGSVDRTVLLDHFGAEPRGYYSPALLAGTFFGGLAAAPNAVLAPRLGERFGRTGRAVDLLSLVDAPLRLMAISFAFVAGVGTIATPALLQLALPKYVPGTTAAQLAIWGLAASVQVGVVINVFTALNRLWFYLGILGVSAAASYGLTQAAVHYWPCLEAVALGTVAGSLLFATLVVIGGWLAMERSFAEAWRALLRALAPLAWAAACAGTIVVFIPRILPVTSLAGALVGEMLFVLLVGPWLWVAVRRARSHG